MSQAYETSIDASIDVIESWYANATVRYTPRILVPDYSSDALVYPVALSAICSHPLVEAQGNEMRSFILAQSAYLFLYGVGLLETKFVIQCGLDLVHDRICALNDVQKLRALTVIIDEGYHAHVALDYIVQMKQKSGIMPITVPQTSRKLDAAARAYEKLLPALRMDFQLLAVTLAENVLTNDIATMGREKELTKSYITLMTDHVADEGRHSRYFNDLMKWRWSQLDEETQEIFGAMLPDFIDDFLGVDIDRAFERSVLQACNFSVNNIERVLQDTNDKYLSESQALSRKTKGRLLRLLLSFGVMEKEANRVAFSNHGYSFH